jgi:hypothetical protein
MSPVVVIDTIMGAGKTTYIIDYMNRAYSQALADLLCGHSDRQPPKFLYVTPLLDEVERVKIKCPSLDFRDPQPIHGRKYYGLDRLIEEGANIATTHALFGHLSQDTLSKLKEQDYVLVIDEVLTCVDYFQLLTKDDIKLLFSNGLVYVDGTSHLRWNHVTAPNYRGKFETIRNLCENGNLIAWSLNGQEFEAGKRGSVLLWQFPVEFLAAFKEVYILTYMFLGSPMRAYLEAEGVSFDLRTVTDKGARLVPWSTAAERDAKERIRRRLKIYEGKLNEAGRAPPGTRAQPLSKGWFTHGRAAVSNKLQTATTNFFRWHSRNGVDTRQFAWTTFKAQRTALVGKGYRHHTQWIPLNAKATNDYRHKTVLAYLANRFCIPEIKGYFESRGVDVYEDLYALSELVQWLWRSAIRDDREPRDVHVYVPSGRMRDLLTLWLSYDDTLSFIKRVTSKDLALMRPSARAA